VSLYRPKEPSDQILPQEVDCLTSKGAIQPVYTNGDFVVYRVTAPQDSGVWALGAGCGLTLITPTENFVGVNPGFEGSDYRGR
jgi:hypothetical protein